MGIIGSAGALVSGLETYSAIRGESDAE